MMKHKSQRLKETGKRLNVTLKKRTPTTFEWWFTECIQICANDEIYPNYKWDLKDCDIWRKRHKDGMSAIDAVNLHFKAH